MQEQQENLQENVLSATEEDQREPDAKTEQDDESSDDPVISQGEVGKLLLLCLLVAVGGTAAAFGIFYLSGYFS